MADISTLLKGLYRILFYSWFGLDWGFSVVDLTCTKIYESTFEISFFENKLFIFFLYSFSSRINTKFFNFAFELKKKPTCYIWKELVTSFGNYHKNWEMTFMVPYYNKWQYWNLVKYKLSACYKFIQGHTYW
jgi:hypothetical protein